MVGQRILGPDLFTLYPDSDGVATPGVLLSHHGLDMCQSKLQQLPAVQVDIVLLGIKVLSVKLGFILFSQYSIM